MPVLRFEGVLKLLFWNIPSVSTTTSDGSIEKIRDKSIDKPDWFYMILNPNSNNRDSISNKVNTCECI